MNRKKRTKKNKTLIICHDIIPIVVIIIAVIDIIAEVTVLLRAQPR